MRVGGLSGGKQGVAQLGSTLDPLVLVRRGPFPDHVRPARVSQAGRLVVGLPEKAQLGVDLALQLAPGLVAHDVVLDALQRVLCFGAPAQDDQQESEVVPALETQALHLGIVGRGLGARDSLAHDRLALLVAAQGTQVEGLGEEGLHGVMGLAAVLAQQRQVATAHLDRALVVVHLAQLPHDGPQQGADLFGRVGASGRELVELGQQR